MHNWILFRSWQLRWRFGAMLAALTVCLAGVGSGSWIDEAKSAEPASKNAVTCLAGCNAPPPHVVHHTAPPQKPGPAAPILSRQWREVVTDVWCHKSGGCRASNISRRRPRAAAIVIFSR